MSSFNMRSPLKWVGSKAWQLPLMREWCSPSRRWVEPFCGGASLAFGLAPTYAHLNDVNPHLMNFYRWLQRDGTFTADALVPDSKEYYYTTRRAFNDTPSAESPADALRFYYLNYMGFKGMWRVNREGKLNTAYGHRHDTGGPPYVPLPNATAYRHIMEQWTLSTGSYHNIEVRPTDFLFVDPPYDTEFTAYQADSFTWDDQVAVATWARRHTGPVVLCNQATPRIYQLYLELGFTLQLDERIERMRGTTQGTATEIIATLNIPRPNSLF